MRKTTELLTGKLIVCDLGSSNSNGWRSLGGIRCAATFVEVDAVSGSSTSSRQWHKHIALRTAVGGRSEARPFYRRRYAPCSSFLKADPKLIEGYGLDSFYHTEEVLQLKCDTLPAVLESRGIPWVDFLKTDLEGLDYDVLVASERLLNKTLVLQSELRFQPFYEGEPPFSTVVDYLAGRGFELINLSPETWKYRTKHSAYMRDGRLVWADTIFFLRPELVIARFGLDAGIAFVKQVVLAMALGLNNYAEYIYEQHKSLIPESVRAELNDALRPSASPEMLLRIAGNLMARFRGGSLALYCARQLLKKMVSALTAHRQLPHVAGPYLE